jgi:uncharacterized protein (TIGR01244 family)
MKSLTTLSCLLAGALALTVSAVAAQMQVTKDTVPGVVNFARVETTVACAGATSPEGVAEVKKLGYASIINLRVATEPNANVDAEAAAAKAAGITFVHLPFNAASPDPALIDNFLKAVTEPANQPAFIHCASANRAAALWLIKRVQVDKWDVDRASAEAAALGLTNPALKAFALDYIASHSAR